MFDPSDIPGWSDPEDIARWTKYFDDLDAAMHEFEAQLSQHHFVPLRELAAPEGMPPDALRDRAEELYLHISELEFRAQFLREEIRAEIGRLPRGRAHSDGRSDWAFGRALDVNG
jgi:hypothetical protein